MHLTEKHSPSFYVFAMTSVNMGQIMSQGCYWWLKETQWAKTASNVPQGLHIFMDIQRGALDRSTAVKVVQLDLRSTQAE